MFSIDTADNNDAIKQNGDKVEFSFNAMVYRWVNYHFNVFIQSINFRILTDTVSVMMEPAEPMSCSVSSSFETENRAEINNTSVSSLNATFELSAQDLSLVSYKIFRTNLLWQGVPLSLRLRLLVIETGQACSWQRWTNLTMKLRQFLLVIHHIARDQNSSINHLCRICYTARDFEIREKDPI